MVLSRPTIAGHQRPLPPQSNSLGPRLEDLILCLVRKNSSHVATATGEAGMQQGSLIRSARKRGPDVWRFRWADRGLYGKRIYRKRVIGTACQYADADSASERSRDY